MKLSNKDLHYALWCAEKHTGNSLYTEAMADLEEAILEIEGYERKDHFADAGKMVDEWTRLDPNDESTYPKEGTPVLFISYNPIDQWGMLTDIASKDVINDWKNISRLFGVVFWRKVMFPPPPGKEEAK